MKILMRDVRQPMRHRRVSGPAAGLIEGANTCEERVNRRIDVRREHGDLVREIVERRSMRLHALICTPEIFGAMSCVCATIEIAFERNHSKFDKDAQIARGSVLDQVSNQLADRDGLSSQIVSGENSIIADLVSLRRCGLRG